jgi:metal-responsive CopG/Arc/MetJ family transcriptional regulator
MPEARPQTRNTIRVMFSVLPSDLAEIDRIAREQAEPGFSANRSEAFRKVLRSYLEAEEEEKERARRKPPKDRARPR